MSPATAAHRAHGSTEGSRRWSHRHGSTRLHEQIADLHPGYAALVMAAGIVSTGLALFGWQLLSEVLFVVAAVAFVVLLVAYAWQVVAYPRRDWPTPRIRAGVSGTSRWWRPPTW
jgi:hypothetical protein